MLSPDTLDALRQALDAIVAEDPSLADAVENFKAELPEGEGAPEGEPAEEGPPVDEPDVEADEPERDGEDDEFSFATAEKKHKKARKGKGHEDEMMA